MVYHYCPKGHMLRKCLVDGLFRWWCDDCQAVCEETDG